MKFIGIIPARYASTRFPGKPLADIRGKTMIQRVFARAKRSKMLSEVYIATDSERILMNVMSFGGNVVMTSSAPQSGTDRCLEAITNLGRRDWDVVVNIQGDEPFIDPKQIDAVCSCFQSEEVQIATLVKKIKTIEELLNPNMPKVVFNEKKEAIYFSRTAIPYYRGRKSEEWLKLHTYYKHIGIYAYKIDTLAEIARLKPSPLEIAESLEQLRWLENGYKINVEITKLESIAIDVPEDLIKANAKL